MGLDIVVKLGRHLVVECDFGGAFSYVYLHGVQGCIWVVLVVDLGLNHFPYNVAMKVSLFSIRYRSLLQRYVCRVPADWGSS